MLTAFGQAYGTLPEKTSDLSSDQQTSWIKPSTGLTQDGKIVSVRLALFAEMVKGKALDPGDVAGGRWHGRRRCDVPRGNLWLSTANPKHRLHQKAAQAVLKALLPESGTDIKGQMRSRQELLKRRVMRTAPGTSTT